MFNLTITKQNGKGYIDSREVAEIIGKAHKHLLRDIRGYCETIEKITQPKVGRSDFFIENTYLDSTGRTLPCYLISKMGAEVIANKLIGEKGVLFTVAYVTKFNELEAVARAEQEKELTALSVMPTPRLGEYNACVRIVVRALRDMGASPNHIFGFLKNVYEPLGISIVKEETGNNTFQMYTAKEIAHKLGVYSVNGNPHNQAIACILNENLVINDQHKRVETENYGIHVAIYVRYDDYAVKAVKDWIEEYGYPSEIYGYDRTYRVVYKN